MGGAKTYPIGAARHDNRQNRRLACINRIGMVVIAAFTSAARMMAAGTAARAAAGLVAGSSYSPHQSALNSSDFRIDFRKLWAWAKAVAKVALGLARAARKAVAARRGAR
jgi:hypothetical protein